MKTAKLIIELIVSHLGILFFMFFPERSSLFSSLCLGIGMLVLDFIVGLLCFYYKSDELDLKNHKWIKVLYYLAIIFIILGFLCLL